jgi:hypothetical protein
MDVPLSHPDTRSSRDSRIGMQPMEADPFPSRTNLRQIPAIFRDERTGEDHCHNAQLTIRLFILFR